MAGEAEKLVTSGKQQVDKPKQSKPISTKRNITEVNDFYEHNKKQKGDSDKRDICGIVETVSRKIALGYIKV